MPVLLHMSLIARGVEDYVWSIKIVFLEIISFKTK